jgi:Zn finger protein HypA/HybF involved in hydrogenase expression
MIIKKDAIRNGDEVIETRHTVEIVCKACGYDLTEEEISADACADCGADLELKQSVAINATSQPLGSKLWNQ